MKFCHLMGLLILGLGQCVVMQTAAASRLGTGFSYQGRLLDGGQPAKGTYDLRFALFSESQGDAAVADALTYPGVAVTDGTFAVTLDFGTNVFGEGGAWLEIGVKPAGNAGDFVTLSPRQGLTPTPYSIYTLKAESLAGSLPVAQLPPTVARLDADQVFTGTVTFGGDVIVNPAGALEVGGQVQALAFLGDGANLSNVVATALSARLAERLWRVAIPFVAVTNAGNDPDFTGKGSVPYNYRIGKFEVNNHQYVAFLNAVAAEDPGGLFDTNMAYSVHGGIERSGVPGVYAYAVKPGLGQRPVVWVDFHDTLRFCNWLHNGQPTGVQDTTTTEDGAYTITPSGVAGNSILRNPGALYWLPSDDEWYKAAYHQPWEQGGEVHGYWLYPNRSHTPPFSEPPPGDILSANVCCETERTATDVGAYLSASSYYGTFDQGGNVQEWIEEIIYVTNRRLRGGSWVYNEFYTGSEDFEFDTPDYPADGIGFRVAGAALP